jgi:hypothetical protein
MIWVSRLCGARTAIAVKAIAASIKVAAMFQTTCHNPVRT